MSYATPGELKERLGQQYDTIYRGDTDKPVADIVDAEAEINAAVGVRYIVPVTNPKAQPLLNKWTIDLAEGFAARRAVGDKIPEKIKQQMDDVRAQLRLVAKGELIVGDAPATPSQGVGSSTFFTTQTPLFTRDKLKDY